MSLGQEALRQVELKRQRLLEAARQAPTVLATNAPIGSSTLRNVLANSYQERMNGRDFWVGVGSFDDLGAGPNDTAPKGTIAQFLADYASTHPEWIAKHKPPKHMAWWALPREAKQQLEADRRRGLYGGVPNKAPYWHIQNVGNAMANVRGTGYIDIALRLIRQRWEIAAR